MPTAFTIRENVDPDPMLDHGTWLTVTLISGDYDYSEESEMAKRLVKDYIVVVHTNSRRECHTQ